jgi:hypothetical protein
MGSVCDKIDKIKMIGKVQRFDICASDPDRGPEVTMIRHHLIDQAMYAEGLDQVHIHDKEKKLIQITCGRRNFTGNSLRF